MDKTRFGNIIKMTYMESKKASVNENECLSEGISADLDKFSKTNKAQIIELSFKTEPLPNANNNIFFKNDKKSLNVEPKSKFRYSELFTSLNFSLSSVKKIYLFLKVFFFPHIITTLLIFLIHFSNKLTTEGCFLPPDCICGNILLKLFYALKEGLFHSVIFIFMIILNPLYRKCLKICFLIFQILFHFAYFLFFPENIFARYPIYLEVALWILFYDLYCFKGHSFKEKIQKMSQLHGPFIIHLINFLLFYFLIPFVKELLWSYAYHVLFSLYISVYFSSMEKSLVKLELYMEKESFLEKSRNLFFQFNARISISFLLGFLATPFFDLNLENWSKYIVAITYINSLINFYTKINIIQNILVYLWNLAFKKWKKIIIKKENDPKKILIRKKISGYFLDVIFLGSVRTILFLFWEDRIYYSKCYLISPQTFGVLLFLGINIIITIAIILYVIARKIDLLRYPTFSNVYMNIYFLLLTICLFEINFLFFVHMK